MKPIMIFRHIECEGPGFLAEILVQKGLSYQIVAIDQEAPIPANVDDASALVFMGGPMSVNDPLPWIARGTWSCFRAITKRRESSMKGPRRRLHRS